MTAYDGGDETGALAWSHQQLELGVPAAMDNATFIEWTERQMETPEETSAREERRKARHREWHRTAPGIYACCITVGGRSNDREHDHTGMGS